MIPDGGAKRFTNLPAIVWLKSHGYHIVFGITILSLAALVAWWSVFIRKSIELQHDNQYDSMAVSARYLALSMGHDRTSPPKEGVIHADHRLEIIRLGETSAAEAEDQKPVIVPLMPFWPEFSIRPRPEYVSEIEKTFRRQVLMVVGESGVLVLVIIISSFMLYRVIYLERRSAKELKEFWGRLTHEIKTPITGIKAFLQTLQSREFTREELEPLVKLALREVERQEMLAENLLVGQRIEREGFGLKLKPVLLAQRVKGFFEEHRIIIPDGALTLKIDCDSDVKVIADPDAMWVILENLTDNALKYGGRNPKIECRVFMTESHGNVVFSDAGVGFDPVHAELIFGAYSRLTDELPAGRHGTGMGLYLSRRLARKMGGDLSAHSEGAGKGSAFSLKLKKAKEKNAR